MNLPSNHLGEIFILSKLFSCNEIILCAWNRNAQKELIALYLRSGDFVYYSLTEDSPVVKQIPWFSDSHHTPISINFSPSGDSLLVLSISCNLYILPAFSLFEVSPRDDYCFCQNDITILTYPFTLKTPKTKANSKSPNSNLGILSCSSMRLSEKEKTFHFNCGGLLSDCQGNEILVKFKEISDVNCDLCPTAVCWWQSTYNSKEVGIIGTKSGHVIFVNLFTGIKIGETRVRGEVKWLSVCQDNILDNVFLLITVENEEQYKLILEQRELNYVWSGKQKSSGSEDRDFSGNTNASSGNGNGAPSTRARLQGLKQMSAEKLAMLKNKIAETRAKIAVRQEVIGEVSGADKFCGPPPENLGSLFGDTLLFPQCLNKDNVLVGYYTHSQLLTVHSMSLDLTPLSVHKMPVGAEEILVCERVIYAVSNSRTSLSVISAKLSETWIESSTDFDIDWVIEEWDLSIFKEKTKENLQSLEVSESNKFSAKTDASPENCSNENEEKIISVYRSGGKTENFDIAKTYKLNTNKNEIPDVPNFPKIENCIVITNKNVYIVELKSNIVKVVLDAILEAHDLGKAERICTIFGINLQKLLELAGDIKLAALDFAMAIAFYKLSKCGLLKSIVKLACGNHCSQVLNYSTMLMANSISDMSLTERIHLSNIVLMSYSEQILKNENNRNLLEKFSEFLQTNSYFDEILAVSVTGQSLLFSCLHKLITCKGLILDGYNVLIKLMTKFLKSKILERTLNKVEFWRCITSVDLVEAMIVKSSWFLVYVNYVSQHLDELEPTLLERLLKVLDPTAACVRPISRFFKTSDDSFDNDDTQADFPFAKLVELFIVTLLIKLHKEKNDEETYCIDLIKPIQETSDDGEVLGVLSETENFGSEENLSDEIWPIRKDIQGVEKSVTTTQTCLSCGYGHTALIRNGNVYTWGHTAKGCLGQGPTMSRFATPSPITWFSCFKLEVSLVSCGKYHTAALTNNGIYTWGCSKYGQLGLGAVIESPHPRLVSALANENVISLCCGQYHTLALSSQGSVFSWGWGVHGQLGLGSVDDQRYPKYVEELKEHVIVDIKAGHGHSLVLSDKGHIYSFGSGIFGQLGISSTLKKSRPVLVKGINGKVVCIATGYFHNLALTETNALYTWGASPQCLRFLAQARKRSRLLQCCGNPSVNTSDIDTSKSVAEEYLDRVQEPEVSKENSALDKTESEEHLSPSLVDTSNVTGKIIQISCGCHHSALVTDSGGLYTWGRSIDGQLGNGGHREISIPTQINVNSFKVDCVSCGCEFTTAQERHTGKIYSWGSNSIGQFVRMVFEKSVSSVPSGNVSFRQRISFSEAKNYTKLLATPVKESATKSLDGKLVMLKSCKRIVRLLDRNTGSNSVDTPKEVPDIPLPIFTYHTLNKHITSSPRNFLFFEQKYCHRRLHFIIETFSHIINLSFLLDKSLECSNYQAASKILMLENKCKKSIVYQLKALQSLPKYHLNSYVDGKITEKEFTRAGKPLWSSKTTTLELIGGLDPNKVEYMQHATYILETYIDLNLVRRYEGCDVGTILEVGIQFWVAEKLPMIVFENFLLTKLDDLFYDFGFILFCQQEKGDQLHYLKEFSSRFLFMLISKIMVQIEKSENYTKYLEAMSRILSNKTEGKIELTKKIRGLKKKKLKSEMYVDALRESLSQEFSNEDFIKVSYEDLIRDNVYFFSCGHYHSSATLSEEFKLFEEIGDEMLLKKLKASYEIINQKYRSDLSCPLCVRNYLKK